MSLFSRGCFALGLNNLLHPSDSTYIINNNKDLYGANSNATHKMIENSKIK
jgi:hypothetical protein